MIIGVRKSNSILKSNIDFLLSMGIIRKSRGLFHRDSGTYMGMGPEAVLDDHDHLAHTFDDQLGIQAHHPIHAHNPETLELDHSLDKDGKPKHLHPIDAVRRDLSRLFQRRVGYGADDADFLAQKAIEGSIEMYNSHHDDDSNHTLPPFNSVEWRRNNVMPYVKSAYAGDRQIRSADPHENGTHFPMGVYHLNSSNPRDANARGMWADSGAVVFHEQLGKLLRTWNQDPNLKLNLDESVINNLEYVRFPHIGVDKMTDYSVIPANMHHMDSLRSGVPQDQLATDESVQEATEAGQHLNRINVAMAGLHPAMTAVHLNPDGSIRASSGRKGNEEAGTGKVARARKQLLEAGIEVDENEFKALMSTGAGAMLFGRPGETGAKFNTILRALEREAGIDRESNEYKAIYRDLLRAGNRFGGHRGQSEAARRYAAAVRMAGGPEKFNQVEYEHKGHVNSEEHDGLIQRIVEGMAGDVHTAHDYSKPMRPLTQTVQSPQGINHAIHPDSKWHDYVMTADKLALPGTGRAAPQPQQQPQLMQPQVPLQTRRATPEEQALREPIAGLTPEELRQYQQMQGSDISEFRARREVAAAQPGQAFFDINQPDPMLVYRSERDIRRAIDDIQKTMEKIQLQEAAVDSTIKKHLPQSPLNSSLDIGLFAKSINLTSHDVWAIHSSKGDWDQLAQDWNVSDTIVKAIKVAMGAIHG